MATCRELITRINEKISGDASVASDFGATYKFVLDGEGGGTWVVDLKDTPKVTEGDGTADCTLNMDASDFVDLLEGRADGQQLFFQGKLRIEGDMGLALKLQNLAALAS